VKKEVRTDAFIFRWKVNQAGYEWLNAEDGKPCLVPRPEPGKGILEKEPPKGLFAEFASLEPTKGAIQDFAGKYGNLLTRALEQVVKRNDRTATFGASLGTWKHEIGQMRGLVDLWEHIRMARNAELRKIITWKKTKAGDTEVSYVIETPTRKRNVTLAHSAIRESGLSGFSETDVVLPAQCALQLEINLRLVEHPTVPRLAWTPDYDQRIIFSPPHLLAFMWLRFAQAVTGELQIRQCAFCGGYFQVGPGGRRADSTTCKNACRQAKSRPAK
jgi:hypothetical protein